MAKNCLSTVPGAEEEVMARDKVHKKKAMISISKPTRRAARRASSSSGASLRITACPLVWEAVTFFTGRAPRMASLTWASHIPHIMPSTFTVVSIIWIPLLLVNVI